MDISEIVSVLLDIVVVFFIAWFLIVRRAIDKRIDTLAKTLISVTDLISKNLSWVKTAEEITAMEEALSKRHEIEMDSESKKSLDYLKKVKLDNLHTETEFRILVGVLQIAVPEEIRVAIAEQLEADRKHGDTRVIKALRGESLNGENDN